MPTAFITFLSGKTFEIKFDFDDSLDLFKNKVKNTIHTDQDSYIDLYIGDNPLINETLGECNLEDGSEIMVIVRNKIHDINKEIINTFLKYTWNGLNRGKKLDQLIEHGYNIIYPSHKGKMYDPRYNNTGWFHYNNNIPHKYILEVLQDINNKIINAELLPSDIHFHHIDEDKN